MAASKSDRLFAEVDRQLAEIRSAADGLATRAGIMMSATAVAAGVFSVSLTAQRNGLVVAALIMLGIATLVGTTVLVPAMKFGPQASSLSNWSGTGSADAIEQLYAAKLLALEANLARLALMRTAFYAQFSVVVLAIGLAVAAAAVH